ncbi:MAG: CDP-alcohol phosphatidyltransferase family protein [Bacteroidota bacterium]
MISESKGAIASIWRLIVQRESWTVSNLLSLLRLLLVLPIVLLLFSTNPERRIVALLLMVIAGLTDSLDGLFARTLNQVTELGKILDPFADKVAIGSVGITLFLLGELPLWYVALIVGRDALIIIAGLIIQSKRGAVPPSNLPGKIAVTAIALTIFLAAVPASGGETLHFTFTILLWASILLLFLSLVVYARRFYDIVITQSEIR